MRPFAVIALLSGLAVLTACESEPSDGELMASVSVQDARDLLTEAGAHVERVEFVPDGFTVTASLTPERHVWFHGMNCKGVAEATACTEFKISSGWEIDTASHATALAKLLNYNYTSVDADGTNLELWRMDFVYGGITREHLRRTVHEFLELRQKAENVIWPPATSASLQTAPGGPPPPRAAKQ